MKSRRIFSILVLIGLVVISITAAQAQNNGAAELKKRIFAQIASGARSQAAQTNVVIQSQSAEAVVGGQVVVIEPFAAQVPDGQAAAEMEERGGRTD